MICTIRTRPFRISVSPYTGSVEVCFLHQTSFSACIFFLVRKCRNLPNQMVFLPFLKPLVVGFGNVSYLEVAFR